MITKSLWRGLRNLALRLLFVALVGTLVAALLTIRNVWDEKILHDGHTAAVRRAVYSPDGRLLVSVGEDRRVIAWDVDRRERVATLESHRSPVVGVVFSPDGRRFATSSADGEVIVWNTRGFARIARWRDVQAGDGGIAFSQDGRLLAYSAYNGTQGRIRVVNTEGGTLNWEAKLDSLARLLFSRDGSQILSGTGLVCSSTAASGRSFPSANWIAASPDYSRIVTVDAQGPDISLSLVVPRELRSM